MDNQAIGDFIMILVMILSYFSRVCSSDRLLRLTIFNWQTDVHAVQVDDALGVKHTQNIGTSIKVHFLHSQVIYNHA